MELSALPEWTLSPVRLVAADATSTFPRRVSPDEPDADPADWFADNHACLDRMLLAHGALLFRGFHVPDEHAFERAARALSGSLEGRYGDLVKRETASFVYDATVYPKHRAILFHNEGSHTPELPTRQMFYCGRDAFTGGETPFVDCRRLYRAIRPELRDAFEEKGLLYVRNFIRGVDVGWQDFFRTDDRSEVERRCRAQGVRWEWKRDGTLRTLTEAPAVVRHPVTSELSFCNQIMLHHVSCLDAKTKQALLSVLGPSGLPRSVTFGDGTPISEDVMIELLRTAVRHAVRFRWQRGDILLLDNLTVAHARSPFDGDRQILVAIGDVMSRREIRAVRENLEEGAGNELGQSGHRI